MTPTLQISTLIELEELCSSLVGETEIALDFEMDSLHHYREKICLVQLSWKYGTALIDPLQCRDLSPLEPLLASPVITKIMHGSDYDIRLLHRDFALEITNLFDTMVAARFLGLREFGLASLLQEKFGILLDKKLQKADWSIRPLTAEMIEYAAEDTRHLIDLYHLLKGELAAADRLAWVAEECSMLTEVRCSEKSGMLFQYCKGAAKLGRRSLTLLEELLQMREKYAGEHDRPTFKVIPSEVLVNIAEIMPEDTATLASVKGFSPSFFRKFGASVLQLCGKVRRLPESSLLVYPRSVKPNEPEGTKELVKKLKKWRDELATKNNLEAGLLLPNRMLEQLAAQKTGADSAKKVLKKWQIESFGSELEKLISER